MCVFVAISAQCDIESDTVEETCEITGVLYSREQFKKHETPFALHFLLLPFNLIAVI